MSADSKEICRAVSADWKRKRITHQLAAEKLGTTRQVIANILSAQKSRISARMAHRMSEAFGYDERFLLYGEGTLLPDGPGAEPESYYLTYRNEPLRYGRQLRAAERLLEILNNKVAVSAFHAYMNEEWEEYEDLVTILEKDYGYTAAIYGLPPHINEELKKIRRWFTDMETQAAKELVLIEQKAARGEVIDIDAETERFRTRLTLLAKAYPQAEKDPVNTGD